MRFLLYGFLGGLAFYCATAFPAALIFHLTGDAWGGFCMLYGVVCGSVGVNLGARVSGGA